MRLPISEDMFLIYLLKNKPNLPIAAHGTLLQAEQRHWHLPGVFEDEDEEVMEESEEQPSAKTINVQVSALNCHDRAIYQQGHFLNE